MFHNAHEFVALYPNVPRPNGYCARRVEQGAEFEAIRRRLAVVAGKITRAAQPDAPRRCATSPRGRRLLAAEIPPAPAFQIFGVWTRLV